MGIIDWLNSKLEYKPRAALHIDGVGSWSQEVVGESHYQKHLKMLHKAWNQDSKRKPLLAELHCENDNAYDSNAVKVTIQGLCVGYLPKKDAKKYRKKLLKAELGEIVLSCNAWIFGGKEGMEFLGVWLDLPISDL